MQRKIKTKTAAERFDSLYNDGKLDKYFNEYKHSLEECISNKIVEEYATLIEMQPEITDGEIMFEYWAWAWYREALIRQWGK